MHDIHNTLWYTSLTYTTVIPILYSSDKVLGKVIWFRESRLACILRHFCLSEWFMNLSLVMLHLGTSLWGRDSWEDGVTPPASCTSKTRGSELCLSEAKVGRRRKQWRGWPIGRCHVRPGLPFLTAIETTGSLEGNWWRDIIYNFKFLLQFCVQKGLKETREKVSHQYSLTRCLRSEPGLKPCDPSYLPMRRLRLYTDLKGESLIIMSSSGFIDVQCIQSSIYHWHLFSFYYCP